MGVGVVVVGTDPFTPEFITPNSSSFYPPQMSTSSLPFHSCPRYPKCSVNHCPLDPNQSLHLKHPLDSQPSCTLAKSIRSRIASQFTQLLPLSGLTPKEHAGAMLWASCSPAKKLAAKARLSDLRNRRLKENTENLGL